MPACLVLPCLPNLWLQVPEGYSWGFQRTKQKQRYVAAVVGCRHCSFCSTAAAHMPQLLLLLRAPLSVSLLHCCLYQLLLPGCCNQAVHHFAPACVSAAAGDSRQPTPPARLGRRGHRQGLCCSAFAAGHAVCSSCSPLQLPSITFNILPGLSRFACRPALRCSAAPAGPRAPGLLCHPLCLSWTPHHST